MKLQNTPLFSLFKIQNTNSVLLNHFACSTATVNGSGSSEAHSCSSTQPLLYLHYLVGLVKSDFVPTYYYEAPSWERCTCTKTL